MGNSDSARYSDGREAYAQPNRQRFLEAARRFAPSLVPSAPRRPAARALAGLHARLRSDAERWATVRAVAREAGLEPSEVVVLAQGLRMRDALDTTELRRRAANVVRVERAVLRTVGLPARRLSAGESGALRSAALGVASGARAESPDDSVVPIVLARFLLSAPPKGP